MVQYDLHRLFVLRQQWRGKNIRFPMVLHRATPSDSRTRKQPTIFFPCSGNGNGASWNNRGANGNYWSSSLYSATNGRNLNFNSGGVNPQNNNNRFNGFAARPVQHSLLDILFLSS